MKQITIAMLAHVDAGKTTLSEAMLYHTGVIKKMGRVDKKDAFLDYDAQERSRGITIFSKQSVMTYKDSSFTFLDTPGHVDFACEMERTLQVLDYAIVIISARDGIQGHTKTIWKLLSYYKIPTFIFVNKMDLSYQSQAEIIIDLQKDLDANCYSIDKDFKENISLVSDELLEKYLNGDLNDEDIQNVIINRNVFPVCFGSSLKDEGVKELLDILNQYTKQKEYDDTLSGIVFKKISEKNNQITFLKLTGGHLKVKDTIDNQKIDEMRIYSGKNYENIQETYAGEIIACKGLDALPIGYVFGKNQKINHILKPFTSYHIILPDDIDKHQAIDNIKKLSDEDPSLQISYNENTQELSTKVMGEIQLETLKNMVKERYQYDIDFDEGKISYLETITNKVEGVGHYEPLRHYAEVHILLEPLERGQGIVIENNCQKDTLPVNFQKLVLSHMSEIEHIGVLTGSPITDIKMTLVSGRAHLKHTEGGDFREATYRAIRNGLKKAHSLLLEPYYDFEIKINNHLLSKIIYDLDRFHSEYQIKSQDDETIIIGYAPVRYMLNYHVQFMSMTKGEGKLFYSLSGYRECLDSKKIIEDIGYDSESDRIFPTGSVFCQHGAGFYVSYDEVENYMHLPYIYQKRKKRERKESFKVNEKELEEIFIRTYGPIKRRLSKDMNHMVQKVNEEKVTILPECLLVDGYNIIFSWDELNQISKVSLDNARETLINILCNYQGYRKCLLILVFDAYKVKKNIGSIEKYDNIYIVYTKEAQTADNYIESVTHDLAQNYRVYVATSDALEQTIVASKGAMRISARELELLVRSTHQNEFDEFNRKNKQMKNYLLEDIKKER